MNHEQLDVVVGVLFVVFYSGQRFNTPSTNRSSTTAGRYFLALCPYCLSAAATYLVLVLAGTPSLIRFLAGNAVLEELEAPLSNPLLVALLMTVLLPKLPLLSAVDRWVYTQLQAIAAIPYEVRRLSAELSKSPFAVSDDVQVAVTRRLENDGFREQDIRFGGEQVESREWTLLTTLLMRVDEWRCDRRMAAYFVASGDALQGIKDRHAALTPKARICFELLHETRAAAETDKAREAVRRYADDFSDQVSKLREDLLAFISRGILHADLTGGARNRRLAALGFPELERPSLTLNQLLSVFGLVSVVMLSASAIVAPLLAPGGIRPTSGVLLGRALMTALIYSVAVGCAVLPKQRWRFANRAPGQPRPVGFYLLAGAMAVGMSQSIGFAYHAALARSFHAAADRLFLSYPWAMLTFALTIVTAVLVDDAPPAKWPRWTVSAVEGLCAAIVMALVAWFTVGWLRQRIGAHPALVPGYRVPPLLQVLTTAGAVGLVVGLLVPRWCREAPRRQAELPEPGPRPSPGAVRAAPPSGLPPAAMTRSG